MTREEIIHQINILFVDEFEIDETNIGLSSNLLDVLKIDSLDLVDLVVIIEKKFGFKIQAEDMAAVKTVEDFYSFVIDRVDQQKQTGGLSI